MATANQKYIIDTHRHKRKKSKHNIKDSHQIRREENKRKKGTEKTYKNNPQEMNKMAVRT